jgi:hypothetical protein
MCWIETSESIKDLFAIDLPSARTGTFGYCFSTISLLQ